MHSSNLESFLYFLIAVVIMVPIFKRLKLGAILGYLVAGILIGPQVLHLISEPESVLKFAEIGVVLLLFVIGLDLEPEKLWSMRRKIVQLGLSQTLITAILIAGALLIYGGLMSHAIVIGFALALSSTAFALQLMVERKLITTPAGRSGFAILLLQDLAVIPILLLVQSMSQVAVNDSPPWWVGVVGIITLLVAGRYFLDPLLNLVARYGNRESMTATALLIVVGAAYGMQLAGLSMGLGAFVAGLMLANSSFRHQLESDIEPFKGLTLGLFFIAIGMSFDLKLFIEQPFLILALALGLMILKTLIIAFLVRDDEVPLKKGIRLGLILSQGGEFAFVIATQALSLNILTPEIAAKINLVVGLSMLLTTPLVSLFSIEIQKEEEKHESSKAFNPHENAEVMILGFGRFGQITGRILAANNIKFTALDQDAEHISFLMRFGNKVHFGDATRIDLLKAAGIEKAKTVVIAIDEPAQVIELSKIIKTHFPKVYVVARARNRAHHMELVSVGADKVIREMMDSSLQAASETLHSLGFTTGQALEAVKTFRNHDEKMITRSMEHKDNLDKLVELAKQGRKELEQLFGEDSDPKRN